MRITADTNILLRAILEDDPIQAADAKAILGQADLIAIPVSVLCELVWTMRRLYKRSTGDIADAIETLLGVDTVVTDRPAVEVGLNVLRAGGDFADGTIAWQGAAMGGDVFVTFDQAAARLLAADGMDARVPPFEGS